MLYTISNKDLKVQVSDYGAELKSIKYLNDEYLHNSDPKYWCYSAPLLWPNIGMLKDNQTYFNGKAYPLKKHGFARNSTFKLINHTDNAISFLLSSDATTFQMYPFNFDLYVKYELINQSIKSTIKVVNKSNELMPFNLGLHPAFKVPHRDSEKFEDFHVLFNKVASYETPTVDLVTGLIDFTKRSREFINLKELNLDYKDYDNDALIFENIKSDCVILEHKTKHYGVKFEFPDFTHLGIWTPNNNKFANFICLEPWIGCADRPQTDGNFTSKRDIIYLDNQEEKEFHYKLTFF